MLSHNLGLMWHYPIFSEFLEFHRFSDMLLIFWIFVFSIGWKNFSIANQIEMKGKFCFFLILKMSFFEEKVLKLCHLCFGENFVKSTCYTSFLITFHFFVKSICSKTNNYFTALHWKLRSAKIFRQIDLQYNSALWKS